MTNFDKIDREWRIIADPHARVSMGDRLRAGDSMRLLLDVAEADSCPNCPDQGWYTGSYQDRHGDECPEQIQCEFCETHPKSRFQALTKLKEHCDPDDREQKT